MTRLVGRPPRQTLPAITINHLVYFFGGIPAVLHAWSPPGFAWLTAPSARYLQDVERPPGSELNKPPSELRSRTPFESVIVTQSVRRTRESQLKPLLVCCAISAPAPAEGLQYNCCGDGQPLSVRR
ncbi:hypothetical protein ZHAS_00018565 [Anopheles sinensis]|uniref:Uncharacterized protein n=1 Tax=Anopheles sinensis TaxID=74873 RepID=A0A084WJY0_ANOSI|nr:hypothetical protein ZHAS_00018565 [Anopheles sinensis]